MHTIFDNPIDLLLNLPLAGEVLKSEQYYQQIQQNADKLKPFLHQQLCSVDNESGQRMFIRNLHTRLVSINDSLYSLTKGKTKEGPAANTDDFSSLWAVLFILDDFLAFIWYNYKAYCDKGQKMPEKSKAGFIREINGKLEKLGLPGNDPDHLLFEKVKSGVSNRLKDDQAGISFGLMAYLDDFIRELVTVRASNKEHSLMIRLMDVLIAFNFNALPVLHYLLSVVIEDLEKFEPVKDKIERLHYWLKQVNQVPVSPNLSFYDDREPVKHFLNNWLCEETRYYEKSLLIFSSNYPVGVPGIIDPGFKIETDLSVTQIACFVRLFMDCGVFKNTNVREILTFLAEHIRSKRQENISAESLRLKYYNIEESTRGEVRKVLSQMLDKSDRPL
jgi:hypothetical protein